MTNKEGAEVADLLQKQLSRYNDLHLTLKHIHWNVVGPNFIGVHEMIDPQVNLVRKYADAVAERIAAPIEPGTTTRCNATMCKRIWGHSTWSTPG
jgi:starvation-inducible DNA-binding protein